MLIFSGWVRWVWWNYRSTQCPWELFVSLSLEAFLCSLLVFLCSLDTCDLKSFSWLYVIQHVSAAPQTRQKSLSSLEREPLWEHWHFKARFCEQSQICWPPISYRPMSGLWSAASDAIGGPFVFLSFEMFTIPVCSSVLVLLVCTLSSDTDSQLICFTGLLLISSQGTELVSEIFCGFCPLPTLHFKGSSSRSSAIRSCLLLRCVCLSASMRFAFFHWRFRNLTSFLALPWDIPDSCTSCRIVQLLRSNAPLFLWTISSQCTGWETIRWWACKSDWRWQFSKTPDHKWQPGSIMTYSNCLY